MWRFKILGLTFVASLAIGALTAGAASAERGLTLSAGILKLPPGEQFAFVDETFSPWGYGLFFDLGDKEVTCSNATFQGFVVTNGKPADELRITKSDVNQCLIGGTNETATVALNGPLKLKLTDIGLARISKYQKTTPTFTITIPNLTCTYRAPKINGFFEQAEGAEPERLTVNFEGSPMYRVQHESSCPKESSLRLQFTYGGVAFFYEIEQVVTP